MLGERVDELRRDRSHGASWMARRAIEALVEVAEQPVADGEELLARLTSAGRELATSRAGVGAIAAAVFHDGTLCNKAGTRELAEAAADESVPALVACEVIKLAPINAADAPAAPEFDLTPPELIDRVVTEEGAYLAEEIRALVDRT